MLTATRTRTHRPRSTRPTGSLERRLERFAAQMDAAGNTTPQRRAALLSAQRTRWAAAAARHALTDGETTLELTLADPSARNLTVRLALESLPGMGAVKARKLARVTGAPLEGRLSDLTDRQRAAMVAELKRFPPVAAAQRATARRLEQEATIARHLGRDA